MEETPWCSKVPNHWTDWKLNPNVECRIILNKLNIKTPECETIELCRTLTNRSFPTESTVSPTKDVDFNLQFVLDVLLNEILGKCEEKCKVCEEYVHQLRHHIIQTHSGHPNPSPHPQTVTVFKCDVCSSIYSSPSILIRHRNTHSDNSNTLITTCTNESEPVRFDSNNIYASFDISTVPSKNECVSSVQYENHSHQPVPVPPENVKLYCLKQEPLSSQSELEISNLNQLGIPQHMNYFSTIENNLKQESDDLEYQEDLTDPLLLQDVDLQVPSSVKSECTIMSFESEQHAIPVTHDMSPNDTDTGGESLPVLSDLITHKITHTRQKPQPHECDVCGKCFDNLHELTRHKIAHLSKKPHKCDVCGKCFERRFDLTRHQLTHTEEKSFRCDVCGKCFGQSAHLTRHKVTHTGEKPFHCDECGEDFSFKSYLANHKLTHTGERERPHSCNVCGMCFGYKSVLLRHKLTHTGEKPFRCDVCGWGFTQAFSLTMHKRTHTGEKTHRRHTCVLCGMSFTFDSDLTRHSLTHTREKPFHCDECGKDFTLKSNLSSHKLIHTGERPHKCDVCGKCFVHKVVLVRHKRTHTKETPYVNGSESEEEGCQEDPFLSLDVSS